MTQKQALPSFKMEQCKKCDRLVEQKALKTHITERCVAGPGSPWEFSDRNSFEEDRKTVGKLQVIAGDSLLIRSGLVQWDKSSNKYAEVGRAAFEAKWKNRSSPIFGRLISWMNFSTGAEFLAKGLCLVNGVEIREIGDKLKYPSQDPNEFAKWLKETSQFLKPPSPRGDTDPRFVRTVNFGTLGYLWNGEASPLRQLCNDRANPDDLDKLLAGYILLAERIRNRDMHAYIPDVRNNHYWLVPELFVECFNILATWLPGGSSTLHQWRKGGRKFVTTFPMFLLPIEDGP